MLYHLRLLNCTMYTYRQYIHEEFQFLFSYQPFESHHLVGSHQLQGVMKVTDMTLNASHCEEEAASHTHTYCIYGTRIIQVMCSDDAISYITIVIVYVTH